MNKIIEVIVHDSRINDVNYDTLLSIFEIFEYCLMRNIIFISLRKEIIKALPRLIDNSKLAMKKLGRHPEIISGVHLLQLLVKNEVFLILDRFDESFSRYEFWGGEWSEDIGRFMHYSSRHIKSDVWFFQDFGRKDTYQMTLYDTIDRKKVLLDFLTLDNLEILLETNPELLSNALLNLLINGEVSHEKILHIVEMFLKGYLNQLESAGIVFIEFTSIINAIRIARYVKAEWFLNHIIDVLRYQLLGRHPKYFLTLAYLYPSFISDIIDVIPEVVISAFPDILEMFYMDWDFRYIKAEKAFDYIKLLRHFSELAQKKKSYNEKFFKGLHMFERMVQESDKFRKVKFEHLTISQIDDLAWYADFTKNEHISHEINDFLKQYFEMHRHNGSQLFK